MGHPFSSGLLGQLLNSSAEVTCPQQLPLFSASSLRLRAATVQRRGDFGWHSLHRALALLLISRPHSGTGTLACCLEALPVTMIKRVRALSFPCPGMPEWGQVLLLGDVVSSPFMAPRMPRRVRGACWGWERSPWPSARPDSCQAFRVGGLPRSLQTALTATGAPVAGVAGAGDSGEKAGPSALAGPPRAVAFMFFYDEQVTSKMPGEWVGAPVPISGDSPEPAPRVQPGPIRLCLWPEITFSQPPVRNGGAGSRACWLSEVECLSPFCCEVALDACHRLSL